MAKSKKSLKEIDFLFEPWMATHDEQSWFINAYSIAMGKQVRVAEIKSGTGFPEEAVARFIVDQVNSCKARDCLIKELVSVVEMCLESDEGKLNWSAEHDAEKVLKNAKIAGY